MSKRMIPFYKEFPEHGSFEAKVRAALDGVLVVLIFSAISLFCWHISR